MTRDLRICIDKQTHEIGFECNVSNSTDRCGKAILGMNPEAAPALQPAHVTSRLAQSLQDLAWDSNNQQANKTNKSHCSEG